MADKTLKIDLIAKDEVSGPMKKIALAAHETAGALSDAGDTGTASFTKLEASTKRTEISARQLGTVLTGLGTVLTYSAKKAMDQERQLVALQRGFGDTADEIIRFAQHLDDITIFSDDDIREGQRWFSTLQNNYDMSIQQIQELMRITADLAAASNVTFADASNRVTAAIRGEAEAAEYLGLTMNQQAIDRDNLTLKMTNAEAAQFRYNALIQQASYYQGTANEMMRTGSGTVAEWRDRMDDAAASVGGFIGPVGTMVTGLGSLGFGLAGVTTGANLLKVALPAVASGARLLMASLGPVGWVLTGISAGAVLLHKVFGDSGDAMDDARGSSDALTASLSSLDDMIKQASLSGEFWLAGTFREWDKQAEDAIAGVEAHIGDLWTGLDTLIQDGALKNGATGQTIVDWIDQTFGRGALEKANANGTISDYVMGAISAGNADLLQGSDLAELERFAEAQIKALIPDEADQKRVADGMKPIWDLMTNPAVDQSLLADQYGRIWESFDQSHNVNQLIVDLKRLERQTLETVQASALMADHDYLWFLREYDLAEDIQQLNQLKYAVTDVNASLTTGEQRAYNESWEGIFEAIRNGEVDADRVIGQLRHLEWLKATGQISNREYAQSVVDIYMGLEDAERQQESLNIALAAGAMVIQGITQTSREYRDELYLTEIAMAHLNRQAYVWGFTLNKQADGLVSVAKALRVFHEASGLGAIAHSATDVIEDARALRLQTVTDNLNALLDVTGYGDPLARWNLAGNATDMSMLAMNTEHASSSLDSVYRIAVGNTDALGRQSSAIEKWAKDLIGVQGEYSKLDDLVKAGRITGTSGVFTGDSEYAQAQRAYNDIARENAEIQEHILTIQAKQAPLIRDQMQTYENYLQMLADEPAHLQMIALGWMDSATAARAMEFQTLAVAAATGQLGNNGDEVFTKMITGAAAADPYLAAILEDMGLISVGADGTISVHLDGVEGAKSEIATLNATIVDLIDLLDDDKLNGSYTATIDVIDNASSPIQNILDLIGSLPDKKTTTIQTVLETHYKTTGGIGVLPFALGGTIPAYASGGVLFRAAEGNRPEIAHFANGGTALLPYDGYYTAPPGTYISPNNAVSTSNTYGGTTINVTIPGPIYGFDDFQERVAEAIAPVFAQAADDHRRSAGV